MGLKEIKMKMKSLNEEMTAIENKIEGASAEETKVLQTLYQEKTGEWDTLKAEKAMAEKREEIRAEVEAMEAKRHETAGKTSELTDVSVPDTKHNQVSHEREHTNALITYFDGKSGAEQLNKIAGKKGDEFMESIMSKDDEGSMLAPRWLRDFSIPQATSVAAIEAAAGKSVEEVFGQKATVLVRDASGTNSGGGSGVAVDFEPTLFKTPKRLDNLPERCWVKEAVGKEAQYPKLTQSTNEFGVAVTWGNGSGSAGEGNAITQSDPVQTQVQYNLERLALLSYTTKRYLRNNDINFLSELAWMYRGATMRALSKAILQGVSGYSNAPTGINTNTAIAAGVGVVARATANQVSYTDLVNLQFDVDDGVFGTGTFVVSGGSTGAMKYIAGLDDSAGRPVFAPENTWGNGRPATIAGEEYVNTVANTAALGSRGDVIYGNFMGYALPIDRQGAAIERSDEFKFNTGEVAFRQILYAGGGPLGADMFSVLGDVSGVSSSSSS
jgi:HK97 family phage major capsid protein